MNNKTYTIPEDQLFRLLSICSNANHCTPNHKDHCECRKEIPIKDDKDNNINFP